MVLRIPVQFDLSDAKKQLDEFERTTKIVNETVKNGQDGTSQAVSGSVGISFYLKKQIDWLNSIYDLLTVQNTILKNCCGGKKEKQKGVTGQQLNQKNSSQENIPKAGEYKSDFNRLIDAVIALTGLTESSQKELIRAVSLKSFKAIAIEGLYKNITSSLNANITKRLQTFAEEKIQKTVDQFSIETGIALELEEGSSRLSESLKQGFKEGSLFLVKQLFSELTGLTTTMPSKGKSVYQDAANLEKFASAAKKEFNSLGEQINEARKEIEAFTATKGYQKINAEIGDLLTENEFLSSEEKPDNRQITKNRLKIERLLDRKEMKQFREMRNLYDEKVKEWTKLAEDIKIYEQKQQNALEVAVEDIIDQDLSYSKLETLSRKLRQEVRKSERSLNTSGNSESISKYQKAVKGFTKLIADENKEIDLLKIARNEIERKPDVVARKQDNFLRQKAVEESDIPQTEKDLKLKEIADEEVYSNEDKVKLEELEKSLRKRYAAINTLKKQLEAVQEGISFEIQKQVESGKVNQSDLAAKKVKAVLLDKAFNAKNESRLPRLMQDLTSALGLNIKMDNLPSIVALDDEMAKTHNGLYEAVKNQIGLSQKLFVDISKSINNASLQTIETLAHELTHGIQTDFDPSKMRQIKAGHLQPKLVNNLAKMTKEEMVTIGERIVAYKKAGKGAGEILIEIDAFLTGSRFRKKALAIKKVANTDTIQKGVAEVQAELKKAIVPTISNLRESGIDSKTIAALIEEYQELNKQTLRLKEFSALQFTQGQLDPEKFVADFEKELRILGDMRSRFARRLKGGLRDGVVPDLPIKNQETEKPLKLIDHAKITNKLFLKNLDYSKNIDKSTSGLSSHLKNIESILSQLVTSIEALANGLLSITNKTVGDSDSIEKDTFIQDNGNSSAIVPVEASGLSAIQNEAKAVNAELIKDSRVLSVFGDLLTKALKQSGKDVKNVAGFLYGASKGLESAVFTAMPVLGVAKQVTKAIAPAAAVAGATMMIPGGQAVAQGAMQLTQAGISPIAGQIAELLSAHGLAAIESTPIVGHLIEAAANAFGAEIVEALSAIIPAYAAGNLLKAGVEKSVEEIATNLPQLAAAIENKPNNAIAAGENFANILPQALQKTVKGVVGFNDQVLSLGQAITVQEELVRKQIAGQMLPAKKLAALPPAERKEQALLQAKIAAQAIADVDALKDALPASDRTKSSLGSLKGSLVNRFKAAAKYLDKNEKEIIKNVTAQVEVVEAMPDLSLKNVSSVATKINKAAFDVKQSDVAKKGKDLVDGYAEAINVNSKKAVKFAAKMAIDTVEGIADGQESKSPSKKAAKKGKDLVDGYRLSIKQLSSLAVKQAKEMADDVTKALTVIPKDLALDKFTQPELRLVTVDQNKSVTNIVEEAIKKLDSDSSVRNELYNRQKTPYGEFLNISHFRPMSKTRLGESSLPDEAFFQKLLIGLRNQFNKLGEKFNIKPLEDNIKAFAERIKNVFSKKDISSVVSSVENVSNAVKQLGRDAESVPSLPGVSGEIKLLTAGTSKPKQSPGSFVDPQAQRLAELEFEVYEQENNKVDGFFKRFITKVKTGVSKIKTAIFGEFDMEAAVIASLDQLNIADSVLERLDRTELEYDRIDDRVNEMIESLDNEGNVTFKARDVVSVFEKLFNLNFDRFTESFQNFKNLLGNIKSALNGVLLGLTALVAGAVITKFGKDALVAYARFETLQNKLIASGVSNATEKLADLRKETQAVGTSFIDMAEGYSQLSAATKDTALADSTDTLISGLNDLAGARGLDSETVNRTTTALSQIASKGRLSLEEISGQLGENLAGSLNIAAKSMGVTRTEFIKLVESGKVYAEEFLPNFGRALKQAASQSKYLNSLNQEFNRVRSALTSVAEKFGSMLTPAAMVGIQTATKGLKLLTNSLDILGFVLLSVAIKATIGLIPGFIATASAAITARTATMSLTGALKLLNTTLMATPPYLLGAAIAGSFLFASKIVRSGTTDIKNANRAIKELQTEAEKARKLNLFQQMFNQADATSDVKKVTEALAIIEQKTGEISAYTGEDFLAHINDRISKIDNQIDGLRAKRLDLNVKADVEEVKQVNAEIEKLTKERSGIIENELGSFASLDTQIESLELFKTRIEQILADPIQGGATKALAEKQLPRIVEQLEKAKKQQELYNETIKKATAEYEKASLVIAKNIALVANTENSLSFDRKLFETDVLKLQASRTIGSYVAEMSLLEDSLERLAVQKATTEKTANNVLELIKSTYSKDTLSRLGELLGLDGDLLQLVRDGQISADGINTVVEQLKARGKDDFTPEMEAAISAITNYSTLRNKLVDAELQTAQLEKERADKLSQKRSDTLSLASSIFSLEDSILQRDRARVDFARQLEDYNLEVANIARQAQRGYQDLINSFRRKLLDLDISIADLQRNIETTSLKLSLKSGLSSNSPLNNLINSILRLEEIRNQQARGLDQIKSDRLGAEEAILQSSRQIEDYVLQRQASELNLMRRNEDMNRAYLDFTRQQQQTWLDILTRSLEIKNQAFNLGIALKDVGAEVRSYGDLLVGAFAEVTANFKNAKSNIGDKPITFADKVKSLKPTFAASKTTLLTDQGLNSSSLLSVVTEIRDILLDRLGASVGNFIEIPEVKKPEQIKHESNVRMVKAMFDQAKTLNESSTTAFDKALAQFKAGEAERMARKTGTLAEYWANMKGEDVKPQNNQSTNLMKSHTIQGQLIVPQESQITVPALKDVIAETNKLAALEKQRLEEKNRLQERNNELQAQSASQDEIANISNNNLQLQNQISQAIVARQQSNLTIDEMLRNVKGFLTVNDQIVLAEMRKSNEFASQIAQLKEQKRLAEDQVKGSKDAINKIEEQISKTTDPAIRELLITSLNLAKEQFAVTEASIPALSKQIDLLKDNQSVAAMEARIRLQKELNRQSESYMVGIKSQSLELEANQSDPFKAIKLNTEASLLKVSNDMTQMRSEAEKQIEQFALDATKVNQILDSIEVNKINEAMIAANPIAQSFRDNLSGIFSGAKNAKDAILDFASSILDSIAKFAANQITNSLFGVGGLLGGLFGVKNFANGGFVPNYADGGFANSSENIKQAMDRERSAGNKPLLAVLGEGEFVIPRQKNKAIDSVNHYLATLSENDRKQVRFGGNKFLGGLVMGLGSLAGSMLVSSLKGGDKPKEYDRYYQDALEPLRRNETTNISGEYGGYTNKIGQFMQLGSPDGIFEHIKSKKKDSLLDMVGYFDRYRNVQSLKYERNLLGDGRQPANQLTPEKDSLYKLIYGSSYAKPGGRLLAPKSLNMQRLTPPATSISSITNPVSSIMASKPQTSSSPRTTFINNTTVYTRDSSSFRASQQYIAAKQRRVQNKLTGLDQDD